MSSDYKPESKNLFKSTRSKTKLNKPLDARK